MPIPAQNPDRKSSVRERRVLRILCSLIPPLRHHVERRWRLRLLQLPKFPPPPVPRHHSRVGDKEWEERMLSLQGKTPSCLDRKELNLPEDGPTRCACTGQVLLRGRCPECACRP